MGWIKRIQAARVAMHPGPYTVDVSENIGTTGFGTMNGARYRVVVKDRDGAPAKVAYALTYKAAYATGRRYADKMERLAEYASVE